MSDLDVKLTDLVNAFLLDIRDLSTSIGGVPGQRNSGVANALDTQSKNLVGAINELFSFLESVDTSDVTEADGSLYFTQSRVLGVTLNGYVAQAGEIVSTDTILQVLQKLDGNIAAFDAAASIDDENASLTGTYSSSKTQQLITERVAAALEGEDLSDIADQIAANMQTLGGVISFDGPQSLTSAQKTRAQQNMGLGDLESWDPVAAYTAARVA